MPCFCPDRDGPCPERNPQEAFYRRFEDTWEVGGDLQPLAGAICFKMLLNPTANQRVMWTSRRELALTGELRSPSSVNPQRLHDIKRGLSAQILKTLWGGGDTDDIRTHIKTDQNWTFNRWRERARRNRESTGDLQSSEHWVFGDLFPSIIFRLAARAFIYKNFSTRAREPQNFETWLGNRQENERVTLLGDIRKLGYKIDIGSADLSSDIVTCAICYIINKL